MLQEDRQLIHPNLTVIFIVLVAKKEHTYLGKLPDRCEMMGIWEGVFAGGVAIVSDYISGSHSRGRGPSRETWGSHCRVRMF